MGGGAEALEEMLARRVEPAFVVGLPAGFVGAAEAKDALRASGLRLGQQRVGEGRPGGGGRGPRRAAGRPPDGGSQPGWEAGVPPCLTEGDWAAGSG